MKSIFALLAALILLSGCLGVSQQAYDSLKRQCEEEKASLSQEIQVANSKMAEYSERVSQCANTLSGRELLLAGKEKELAEANRRLELLDNASAKAAKVLELRALQEQYLSAFGEGGIPSSYKFSMIEAQLAKINDPELAEAWRKIKACSKIIECDSAKANFSKLLGEKTTLRALEVVEMVK
ncbi:MAG: hypothetical protein N3G22_03585 [Candidatus Micrarchaeota archaeon]|nr:hypothetical protein [Candidatus Micrarchaeota archaeon]